MIDTVSIKHAYAVPPDEEYLFRLGALRTRALRNPTWILKPPPGVYRPILTFVYTADSGRTHLFAATSLPRLVNGHNARLLNEGELQNGLEVIADYVEGVTAFPFDPATALVNRVDYCRDIPVGEGNAARGPLLLYGRHLARHRREIVESTLSFKGANSKVRIYDKLAEVRAKGNSLDAIEASRGNLRVEYELGTRAVQRIAKQLHTDRTAAALLTETASSFVMDKLLSDIDFDLCFDDTPSIERLLATYTTPKAWRLSGYLSMVETYGPMFYLDPKWRYSKREFDKARRDCKKAGAWPRSPISKEANTCYPL